MFISVLLPEPDAPMMATYSFRRISRSTPCQRVDFLHADAVDLRDAGEPDDRIAVCPCASVILAGASCVVRLASRAWVVALACSFTFLVVRQLLQHLVRPRDDAVAVASTRLVINVWLMSLGPTATGVTIALPSMMRYTTVVCVLVLSTFGLESRIACGRSSLGRPSTAWLGTFSTLWCLRVSISTSAVRPENIRSPAVSSRISTLKILASSIRVLRSTVRASATDVTLPVNTRSPYACTCTSRRLTDFHIGHVCLIHARLHQHLRQVRHLHDHGAGVVHRAGDDQFADLRVDRRDDAVDAAR